MKVRAILQYGSHPLHNAVVEQRSTITMFHYHYIIATCNIIPTIIKILLRLKNKTGIILNHAILIFNEKQSKNFR